MPAKKTVLITPLNWGLGHATRLVPVIEYLIRSKAKVIIAADQRPLDFLKQRFPETEIVRFPGFEPRYPNNSRMALFLTCSFPKLWHQSRRAHKVLQELVKKHQINIVISDNRYECYSKYTYNVFITHQLNIQVNGLQKLFKPIIDNLINRYIKKFDEIWIPDFEDSVKNLSGILSHIKKYPIENYHFTGPLSRLKPVNSNLTNEETDLLVILSGPEPQRTALEKLLVKQTLKSGLKTTILQSKPEENITIQKDNIRIISHVEDEQMISLIQSATIVISRPGYSTIMDLCMFGKKAIFIPTPGQTEQEYLAHKLKTEGYCYAESQKSFQLEQCLSAAEKYKGLPKFKWQHQVRTLIDNLLSVESMKDS